MGLSYDGIDLALTKTRRYLVEAQPSDDGIDFLYNKYTIEVDFVFNERATATNKDNLGLGDRLGVTVANLQQRLSQPRRPLVYKIGGDVVLFSPLANPLQEGNPYPCDAKGGPFPKVLSFTEVNGGKTAFGTFKVETYLNNCSSADGYALSHRWTDTQAMPPPDWKVHRKVRGSVIFRLDKLIGDNFNADQFRAWFFHPIPDRYQRQGITVWATPDGSRLEYEFEDVQQPTTLQAGIGIVDVQGSSRGSFAMLKSGNPLPLCHARVEVTGYPDTEKTVLGNAAILIAKNRISTPNTRFIPMASAMTFDLRERVCVFEIDAIQLNSAALNLANAPFFYGWWMNTADVVPGFLGNDQFSTAPRPLGGNVDSKGKPSPTGGGSRGLFIGTLASQALSAPCQVPNRGWFNDTNGNMDLEANGSVF